MSQFNVTAARSKFPALTQDQIFFDNAGGSQTLGAVVDSICHYLTNNNVQLGATYRVGKLATARYNEGFAAAAKYVNAQEDEIGMLPLSPSFLFCTSVIHKQGLESRSNRR